MRILLILWLSVLCAPLAPAQDATMDAPPPDGDTEQPPPWMNDPDPGELPKGHHPPPHGEYVVRYMEHLSENSPEEFEKLQRMREEDPEAFRTFLQSRLRERHARRSFEDDPELRELFEKMPEDKRKRLLAKFKARGGPDKRRGPHSSKETHRLETEIKSLVKDYREAGDSDKEQIKADIRVKLEELFDIREAGRRKAMAKMQSKLQELQEAFDKRQENRSAIIERRLQDLTEGDMLKW